MGGWMSEWVGGWVGECVGGCEREKVFGPWPKH